MVGPGGLLAREATALEAAQAPSLVALCGGLRVCGHGLYKYMLSRLHLALGHGPAPIRMHLPRLGRPIHAPDPMGGVGVCVCAHS